MVPPGPCMGLMRHRVQKILLVAALLMPGRRVQAAAATCSGGTLASQVISPTNRNLANSNPFFPVYVDGSTGTACSTTLFSEKFPISVSSITVPQDGVYGFYGFSLLSNQTTVLYLYSGSSYPGDPAGCIAELKVPLYAAVCPFQITLYAGTVYYVVFLTEGAEDTVYLFYDLLPQSFTPMMSTAPPVTTTMPTTPPATTQPLLPLTTAAVQLSSTPAAATSVPPASTTALPLTTLGKASSTSAVATSVPLATTTILATTSAATVAVAISPSTLRFPSCKSPIQVVASVTGTNSATPPSGTVTLSLNGINSPNAIVATAPITGGAATFDLKSVDPATAVAQALIGKPGGINLLPGSYQLAAAYSGDTFYLPASGSATLEVALTCPLVTLKS